MNTISRAAAAAPEVSTSIPCTDETVYVLPSRDVNTASVRVWADDVLDTCRALTRVIAPGTEIAIYGESAVRPWQWRKA